MNEPCVKIHVCYGFGVMCHGCIAGQVNSMTSADPNRCFRLSALVRADSAVQCSGVYSLSQPAAFPVYNTLISTLQMDMGPLAAAP